MRNRANPVLPICAESPFVPSRIVSGGQTGVDRGALDVAIALGIDYGGWCPAGRLAEDGTIPDQYVLREMPTPYYPDRTAQNVIDSDATLILFRNRISGGTHLTKKVCLLQSKPFLCVSLNQPGQAVTAIRNWLAELRPGVLNIAGPRESTTPGGHADSAAILRRALSIEPESSL